MIDNPYELSDEEIWGKEPTWEEQEIEKLNNKLEKMSFELEDANCTLKLLTKEIMIDRLVNIRCLKEENISSIAKIMFENSLKYDNKLLEIIGDHYDSNV